MISNGSDSALKGFIGKQIGLSMGYQYHDEEDDLDHDVLIFGKLVGLEGRWCILEDFYSKEVVWINLDRVDYFQTKDPEVMMHNGKKIRQVNVEFKHIKLNDRNTGEKGELTKDESNDVKR
ncbi:MAG: hypothetical protein QXU18_04665 [Thermoplasmatales archaeon]